MSGRLQTDNFHYVDNSKTSDMCAFPPPDAVVMLIYGLLKAASPLKLSMRKIPSLGVAASLKCKADALSG